MDWTPEDIENFRQEEDFRNSEEEQENDGK